MPPTSHNLSRPIELAAIVAVIAIPIALIVATWHPLEPLSRTNRANPVVQDSQGEEAGFPDDASQGWGGKDARATPASPVVATPRH